MKIVFYFFCIVFQLIFTACSISGSNHRNVSEIVNSKGKYFDTQVMVEGTLLIGEKKLAICDSSTDICLNLEMIASEYQRIKNLDMELIIVSGTYRDHELKEEGGKEIFYPSRLVVSAIKKQAEN